MVKKTKSSEKWEQLLVSAIVTPNPFVVPNEILDKISIASYGTSFKIDQNQPLAVLLNVMSFDKLSPVLKAKQSPSLTSFIHLATLKIAKSLVVPESGSFSAAVALHNVPLGVSAADIKTALSIFGASKIFKPHFVSSLSYAKASVPSVLFEFSLLVAFAPPVAVENFLVFSWLVFLEFDLAKLSVLVESIVKPVGSMVKVFKQFVNGNLVSSSALGLRINKVLVHISIFSRAVDKLE
ncbi:hypothetical protein G9A89_013539 [Geosiphon pyriformis]|nr:hypothetical protein G9A89_013539 [Geosiphon pyriformis]